MARSAAIGDACRLELGFERYRFPGFSVPEGETAFSYLYQLAHDGLLRRYRPVTKRALKQLAHELDVIERTNLAEFFLIVWDLMEFARQRQDHRPGAGERRRLDRGLLPGHHQGRPDRAQAPLRALHQRGARAAGHRHRLRRQPARGGDPVPLRRSTAPITPRWSARSSRTARGRRFARWPRRSASRSRGSTRWPRRSTRARPATWRATWRWTARSRGCSTSSGSTWPPPPSRPVATAAPTRASCTRPRTRRGTTGRGRSSIRSRSARALVAAAAAARARRIGHVGAARVGDDEALRAVRRAGRRGAGGCRRRATTARPGRRAGGRRSCAWTRSRGCRSSSDAACGSCRSVPRCRRRAYGKRAPTGRPRTGRDLVSENSVNLTIRSRRIRQIRRLTCRPGDIWRRTPATRPRTQEPMAVAPPAVRRDRRLPAPPRHPRRRHARHADAAHRARADRARHHARPGRHPVRQGGRRAARPGEDRPPQPADAGRGQRRPRPDRARHGPPHRPRQPPARRPRGVPRHPGRRHGRDVPDREPRPDAGAAQGTARALRGPRRAGRDHPPRPGAGQRRPPVPPKARRRGAGHLRPPEPASRSSRTPSA